MTVRGISLDGVPPAPDPEPVPEPILRRPDANSVIPFVANFTIPFLVSGFIPNAPIETPPAQTAEAVPPQSIVNVILGIDEGGTVR